MTSISDICRQFSVPIAPQGHHHRTSRFPVQVDCPNCSPNTGKFRLGLANTYAMCWICGYRPLVSTLAALLRQPISVVRGLVGDLPSQRHHDAPRRGKMVLPHGLDRMIGCHRDYLANRGFDPDELERVWGLKGIGLASKLTWGVWIPFYLDGEVVSWLTRGITDDSRYRSASAEEEAINHKDLLYGEDYVRHAIAVHEGPTDVWAVGPGAVATCGIGYRRSQVLRIAQYPKRLICFNSEPAAQKRAQKLCRELAVFPGETLNIQYSCKDAAESMLHCPDDIKEVQHLLGRS